MNKNIDKQIDKLLKKETKREASYNNISNQNDNISITDNSVNINTNKGLVYFGLISIIVICVITFFFINLIPSH